MEKYGGEDHLKVGAQFAFFKSDIQIRAKNVCEFFAETMLAHAQKPKDVAMSASTEAYVEYDRQGKIISGDVRPVVRSRYEEDNAPNNHAHVFGSWYANGAWGYACCHQAIYNSYCTGEVRTILLICAG